MKNLKSILLSSVLTLGIFGATTFVSCNPDACKDVVCNNGGTCNDGDCVCASGFEGTNCETQSLSKFLGSNNTSVNYNFSDNGGTTCGNYTGTFTATRSAADTTRLILTNFGGFGLTTSVYATVDKNTLTIPSQAITGATSNTVSGTGTYSNGVISGSYTNNDGTSTCNYTFTWTKQ
jgi:hypothetical protein